MLSVRSSLPAGQIAVFDAQNLHSKSVIDAHYSPVVQIAFSPCGRYLATASEKGTVIRIFDADKGKEPINEVR